MHGRLHDVILDILVESGAHATPHVLGLGATKLDGEGLFTDRSRVASGVAAGDPARNDGDPFKRHGPVVVWLHDPDAAVMCRAVV
jgi:hypothetical protein